VDTRKDDHFISLKNKKQVAFSAAKLPHNRNNSMPYHPNEVDEDIERQMYSKPQRKFWTFEDFKTYTLPKLQLRKVIKI
jgi:hypothetical protein